MPTITFKKIWVFLFPIFNFKYILILNKKIFKEEKYLDEKQCNFEKT